MNVLQPLVQMIDSCNDALTAVAPELKVGSVGVDKLKKAAQNISGIKQLNYVSYNFDVQVNKYLNITMNLFSLNVELYNLRNIILFLLIKGVMLLKLDC